MIFMTCQRWVLAIGMIFRSGCPHDTPGNREINRGDFSSYKVATFGVNHKLNPVRSMRETSEVGVMQGYFPGWVSSGAMADDCALHESLGYIGCVDSSSILVLRSTASIAQFQSAVLERRPLDDGETP